MEIGTQSYNFCVESDAKRIQYAERALTDAAKRRVSTFNRPGRRMKKNIWIQKDVFTVLKLLINGKKFLTLKFFTFSYLLHIWKL